jgi:hypothetical protein
MHVTRLFCPPLNSPTPAAVAPPTLSETDACDRLGNLRVKAGVEYEYPAARQARPRAPIRVGGQPYACDDSNGAQFVRNSDHGVQYTHANASQPVHLCNTRHVWIRQFSCPLTKAR